MDDISVSEIYPPPSLHLNDPNWDKPGLLHSTGTDDTESIGAGSVEKGDNISISAASSKSCQYDLYVPMALGAVCMLLEHRLTSVHTAQRLKMILHTLKYAPPSRI
jgi:hypothetical protein